MTIVLRAKSQQPDLEIGSVRWTDLLERIGLPIGFGRSLGTKQIFQPSKEGMCPTTNDNYPVSDGQARAMARCARGLIKIWREVIKRYGIDALREEQNRIFGGDVNVQGILEDLGRFAPWAKTSRGFIIT